MKNDKWFAISMFLAGCLLTGSGMVIRGDLLGDVAAKDVKAAIEDRLDREVTFIRESIDEIKDMVRDLQER